MRKLVFDTSAIFIFGRRGEMEFLLERMAQENVLLTTTAVEREILDPKNRDYYQGLLKRWFTVQDPREIPISLEAMSRLAAMLGQGEVSVILLASEVHGTAVLDERAARTQALELKVSVTGTLGLLKECIGLKWCMDDEAIEILRRLKSKGFRIRKPGANETFAEYFSDLGQWFKEHPDGDARKSRPSRCDA